MKKISLVILVVLGLTILAAQSAFALPQNRGIEKAQELSPAIDGGKIKAPPDFVASLPESQLQSVFFIRYAPGKSPAATCGNGVCEAGENAKKCPGDCGGGGEPTACYAFLSGARPKWNWVEDYFYGSSDLAQPIAEAVAIWEGATSGDIFGNASAGNSTWGAYDQKNVVVYGNYSDPDVLGVTRIWFKAKNIYEYDIMLDTDYFPSGSFDLETVVLHELGHAAGLGDLYDAVCSSEVMYGYLGKGEIRTTLRSGDTIGIQTLYGN